MRVIMLTDLEGVSGVVSFEQQTMPANRYYEQAKALLTGEINAAVEGLISEGAEDVVVVDGHGAGGVTFELLHPQARLLHGRPLFSRELRNTWQKNFDVAVIVGQHAMAGVQHGNLNHTQSSTTVDYYKLNGKYIGEIAQAALYSGALGVPVIFLSGDRAACEEAADLIPRIITAAVKEGLTRTSAISMSKEKARELIREKIIQALRNHKSSPIEPLVWPGPFTLEKRFFYSNLADRYDANPLAERIDAHTVQLISNNILDIIYA